MAAEDDANNEAAPQNSSTTNQGGRLPPPPLSPASFLSSFHNVQSPSLSSLKETLQENLRMPNIEQYFYFTKKRTTNITTNDLPMEKNAIGILSPTGIFFTSVKLTVPLAYVYIALILWREVCLTFPKTMLHSTFMTQYLSVGVWIAQTMTSSSFTVEVWAVIEGIFYIVLFLHRKYLNSLDTLELSLQSAPMLEIRERAELWNYMLDSEDGDCARFISGWFWKKGDNDDDEENDVDMATIHKKLDNLTRYDIMDFLTWSLFEGRNIEHLTMEETNQLRGFVSDLEYKISIELHGVKDDDDADDDDDDDDDYVGGGKTLDISGDGSSGVNEQAFNPPSLRRRNLSMNSRSSAQLLAPIPQDRHDPFPLLHMKKGQRPQPKRGFEFAESRDESHRSYFSDLYESYKVWCDQYRDINFHPVQDIRNYVAEKTQQLHEAEQSAVATASESLHNAYSSLSNLIEKDGMIDTRVRQLTALSHATQSQIADAWNSMDGMWKMKERLQTASDISTRKKALLQQLKSYRQTLAHLRSMATSVPSKQMADLMKKITQCYEALEGVEKSAMDAFTHVTGYVGQNLLHSKEPPRYLKYSADPLMDVASYPLMFHILILLATEGGLRVMMKLRGFQRLRVGPVSYYYHPGRGINIDSLSERENSEAESIPIVFCHGIGVGLIFYIVLIDELLLLGRPLILPEITYVSGFRPWQSPYCVLPPAAVTSCLMSILACHGFARGAFLGHSYGTSYLSFMCKYAPRAVAAVLFLDPVCFCLHCPRLTKNFVYHRADPGSTSHMIRTDVNVNWTIQRGFPWARISLFTEQIPCVPCAVILSEHDALVPTAKVEAYLRWKGAAVLNASEAGRDHFGSFSQPGHPINVTIFRDQGHGDWPMQLSTNRQVAQAAGALVEQIQPIAFVYDDQRSF